MKTNFTAAFAALLAVGCVPGAVAATITVTNACSYQIAVGVWPAAAYQNGGWFMAANTSVTFPAYAQGTGGRIWSRHNCVAGGGAGEDICTSGTCGGTGIQCAGTTSAGVSEAEINFNGYAGNDYFDVSYVDGINDIITMQTSAGEITGCTSKPTCGTGVVNDGYGGYYSANGDSCQGPCSVATENIAPFNSNTALYCCTGGTYGTSAGCNEPVNWSAAGQAYVNDIHAVCTGQYAYQYDDAVGLSQYPTGQNYTITFCGTTNNATSASASGSSSSSSTTSSSTSGGPEGPYGGTAAAIPGTVQAENYDTGGQGVAYNVTSVNGTANSYRSDGVDLEACSDTGGGYDVGWTAAGQWFKYTVNVATAGTYTVSLRVAADTAVTNGLHISNSAGTNLSGEVSMPSTGGWQTWETVTTSVTLPAGQQTLTVNQDTGGFNLNYISFASSGGSSEAPFGGTPWAIPGTVYGDNYDTGGQGVAYNIPTNSGTSSAYRSDSVDLQTCSDSPTNGYNVGWTAAGQWMKYTVNVATAGTYTVSLRVAADAAVTNGLHIANSSGTNLSGEVSMPSTGSWTAWETVTASVTLPAGQQVLTVDQDTGGYNINYLAFASSGGGGGSVANGTYSLTPECATGLRLDDYGASTANNNEIDVWAPSTSGSQSWAVSNSGVSPSGDYNMKVFGSYCLSTMGTTSGSDACLYACNGSAGESWQITADSSPAGYYQLNPSNATGLCLDVVGAGTADGTIVDVYTCNQTNAQQWSGL